ncbi:MAG: hypothetical protein ACD_45C00273G0003 [uncultured bacterium]|nr:MAG: hypothetical protein ACD_45C00273G0003 [uncultured bacterium]OGT54075.1 MAG: hypothetical protein A3F43_05595 [Gammaproteobacteria bacterium RIFCSPHIGHO2_12_FULL_42_10]
MIQSKKLRHRFILAMLSLCVASWAYIIFFEETIVQKPGMVYYLRPGSSRALVLSELSKQDIVKHSVVFSLFMAFHPVTPLKAGEYLFPVGSTLYSIWHQMTLGKGFYFRTFTIIPGWTFRDLRRALELNNYLRHVVQHIDEKQIMNTFVSQTSAIVMLHPEGAFFPDTYYFTRDTTDIAILQYAYELMQRHLMNVWQSRAADLPYHDAYEALIAASLIEKEACLAIERPIIAGVLINRLHKHMLLQIDPTVIYGLGDQYVGRLYKRHLLAESVYNTYLHQGLPPTPIAMPSLASILASLHPDVHDYYYFVANGDGSHHFSKTLNEHHIAVHAVLVQEKKS